jgi:hypothetical protein
MEGINALRRLVKIGQPATSPRGIAAEEGVNTRSSFFRDNDTISGSHVRGDVDNRGPRILLPSTGESA